ncbi:MAG: hypothetical protein LUH63_10575 [Parabacteroides sp.]|nr:hypothetical protein [Parabacteroides sp.]
MKYRIRYRLIICLALSLQAVGCTKVWQDDPEPPVEEEQATRIVFSSSDFTKADIHAPSDEDGITSIDLYGFVWGMLINRELGGIVTDSTLRIINFVHR